MSEIQLTDSEIGPELDLSQIGVRWLINKTIDVKSHFILNTTVMLSAILNFFLYWLPLELTGDSTCSTEDTRQKGTDLRRLIDNKYRPIATVQQPDSDWGSVGLYDFLSDVLAHRMGFFRWICQTLNFLNRTIINGDMNGRLMECISCVRKYQIPKCEQIMEHHFQYPSEFNYLETPCFLVIDLFHMSQRL